MKLLLRSALILAILLSVLSGSSSAKNESENTLATKVPSVEFLLNNGNMGKLFWVAIPQNENASLGLKQLGIEIIVSSAKNATVTMSIPDLGIVKTKNVEAFKATTFSSKESEVSWTLEVNESEQVVSKGIRLEATEPISVYVTNVKEYSSDGYMAIPVCQWDKEYLHCAYYDLKETGGFQPGKRGGGFIVVASENGTSVTITCDGIGAGIAKTMGGHNIGDSWTVSLDSGKVYMVRGDGESTGLFDISGTKIKASKPVGIISFHLRTMIPSIAPMDRGHLNEWLPPTSTWGKEYVSVQFDRTISSQQQGKGDLFRVVALEDQTKVTCSYYDLSTGNLLGNQDVPLSKAGDWADILDIRDINDRNTKKSVYGVSHWQSTKPFMLLQYSFSNPWDGDNRWSPECVLIPPVEQYIQNTVFQIPITTNFNTNQLTIFAIGDPNDPEAKLLKSVALDGNEIYKNDAKLLANRIAGTNVYWTRILVTEGAHSLTSNTLLSGYIYGFSNAEAYIYTLTSNYHKLATDDIKAPKLTKTMSCGNYTYEASESGTESGLSKILLMDHLSTNYSLTLENPNAFRPQLKIVKQKFYLNVLDNTKPANAIVYVLDRNGNSVFDTIKFEPRNLAFSDQSLDFGKLRVGTQSEKTLTFTNNNTDSVLFTKVYLKGTKFTITNPNQNFKVAPSETYDVNLSYIPSRAAVENKDSDTLIVETLCSQYKFYISGSGKIPVLAVQDWPFASGQLVGTKKCIEDFSVEGLKIDNNGTDVLRITGITGITNPFTMDEPTDPPMPIDIQPGKSVYLKSICFIPSDTLEHVLNATIHSDAYEGDSVFVIKGTGKAKEDPKSVEEILNEPFGITVIPNPSSEKDVNVFFKLDSDDKVRIEISDVNGNVLSEFINTFETKGMHEYKLNTSEFSQGIYYVKMSSGTKTAGTRMIILK